MIDRDSLSPKVRETIERLEARAAGTGHSTELTEWFAGGWMLREDFPGGNYCHHVREDGTSRTTTAIERRRRSTPRPRRPVRQKDGLDDLRDRLRF